MNEEDIKILEEMLNKESSIYKTNKRGNKEIKFEVNSNYYKAIENLINRNKELEEDNKTLKAKIDVCNWQEKSCRDIIDEKFIPKSKIKEKIEEYTTLLKNCNRFSDVDRIKALNERILAYKELLKG